MKTLVFLVLLGLSLTIALKSERKPLHKSFHAQKIKERKPRSYATIVSGPSKYDQWLVPSFAELNARIRSKTKLDDPCKSNPCDINAKCTSKGFTDASGIAYNCACNAGYVGSGMSCAMNNVCTATSCDTASGASCITTGPGKFECRCPVGYAKNGDGCLKSVGHEMEIQMEAAQSATDLLHNMLDDKQSILEKLGRDEVLQDVEDRIKGLIKTRREVLNDLQDQQIDRVERKVKTVEETTQAIAESEKEQGDLIDDLKTTLDNQAIDTQRSLREKAEQILDKAKDQVLNLHRDNFHFDGNTRVDDMDQAVPTIEQRMAILKAKKDKLEYMTYLEEQQRKAEEEYAALQAAKNRPKITESLYMVGVPETHLETELVPELHTKLNVVHARNRAGYALRRSTHVDMVPEAVPVTDVREELVAVPSITPATTATTPTTATATTTSVSPTLKPAPIVSGLSSGYVVPETRN